jgi:hypothetical protein
MSPRQRTVSDEEILEADEALHSGIAAHHTQALAGRTTIGRVTMAKRTQPAQKPLAARVAVVAGATRRAGRGIARALGEAGAMVYCTGRSVKGNPSSYNRPETIDETAEMIVAAAGAVFCGRRRCCSISA